MSQTTAIKLVEKNTARLYDVSEVWRVLMLIGYMPVSRQDGSQCLDLQEGFTEKAGE
jgi:hypothetical protein